MINWHLGTDPDPTSTGFGYAVAFNGTLWVASCDDDFLTSPNAVTWTARSTPLATFGKDVVWCDTLGLFVACGYAAFFSAPIIATSPDGITWTGRTTPWDSDPGTINGLGWSHDLGLIVACGSQNGIGGGHVLMTSPDGINWTSRTSPGNNGAGYFRAAWSSDLSLWVTTGVGGDGGSIMTSPDGVTWTTRLSGGQGADVCWSHGLGLFVVAGDSGGSLAALTTSPDGTTWSAQTTPSPWGAATGITWSPGFGLLVAVHGGTNGALTSPDGTTWTAVTTASTFKGNRLFADQAADLIVAAGADLSQTTRLLIGVPPATPGAGYHGWLKVGVSG